MPSPLVIATGRQSGCGFSRIFIPDSAKAETTFTLLLTWTACQVGSGYCTTIADALAHLRSCPQDNDPLQFIFGDLLARFTPEEERIVATLSCPTEPIPVTAIAEISGVDEPTTRRALKLLTNRSIVIPQEGEEKCALVPMVAEFIRHAMRELVKKLGNGPTLGLHLPISQYVIRR